MLQRKCDFLFVLLILFECGYSANFPLNTNRQFEYAVPNNPIPGHLVISQNGIEFSDFFSPDDWFPVEINVPDAIMSAYDSFGAAWQLASDFFSMDEEQTTQY